MADGGAWFKAEVAATAVAVATIESEWLAGAQSLLSMGTDSD